MDSTNTEIPTDILYILDKLPDIYYWLKCELCITNFVSLYPIDV